MLYFCTIFSLDMKALPVTISWLWSSCTLYLTARHFTKFLVDSFVLIYKGTLLNSVRLELDLERFIQREINV